MTSTMVQDFVGHIFAFYTEHNFYDLKHNWYVSAKDVLKEWNKSVLHIKLIFHYQLYTTWVLFGQCAISLGDRLCVYMYGG